MQCISCNYRFADSNIREKLAFSVEIQRKILHELCQDSDAQCVLLCTCNRTELYFCEISDTLIMEILSKYSGISVNELTTYLRSYPPAKAPKHLFQVASGLHSMVLGEDEILRQTKNAYQIACEEKTVSYELHETFQSAIACAKRIKTETPLSVTPVSVATITANEALRCGNRVLVIGATGQIGTSCVKNLLSHSQAEITVTLRNHNNLLEVHDNRIKTVNYSERYECMKDCDCVISATTSPHFTVTLHDLMQISPMPKLFIDLAVPPDIDPHISQLNGIRRMNIDDFQELAKQNNAIRANSAETAQQIIAEELEQLQKELLFHQFLPIMETVCTKLRTNPEQVLYQIKNRLNAESFQQVLSTLENL